MNQILPLKVMDLVTLIYKKKKERCKAFKNS